MLTHTPSRAKLPFLIAAWMLVAIIALIGSGLTGTTQAQGTSGVIPSINLDSNEAGQLIITWATPEQAPTDYRIRWANTNLGFPSYSAANEPERGNEYPLVDVNTLTLSDLTPGDSYKVQIRSRYYNADRSVRESSGPWTATTTQRVKNHPPAAPTGLTASPVEHNSLTLTWNNPQDTNITGYRIQRGTDANSLHTIEANTGSPSTNYTDITVEPETTYHYAVQALSQDGNGARAITSGTTPAEPDETVQNEPPAVPTGLATSKVSHDSLTLTWDDPEDDSITGYRVMRGDSATSLSTLEDNTQSVRTEYEDATVAPETTYHYAVVALSANGDSPQSSSMSATTPAAPKSKDPPPERVGPRQSLTATEVPTDWGLKPTDVAAGSQFRLIFLSSTKRNGSPTTISNYNIFVQGLAAAGHTDIQTHSTGFRAVVCTEAVDARNNTSTTGMGVPIYWLGGAKVADTYADFYDGSWDDEANDKNESGTNGLDTRIVGNYPVTGCEHNGTEAMSGSHSQGLGSDNFTKIRVARPNSTNSGNGPLSSASEIAERTNTRPMYGLSAVFQVATASTDATLSALTVSPKDISGFAADRTSYEVGVASTVTQATITATTNDSTATVAYSTTDADGTAADHQVDLSAGRNAVTVTVTAEDATTTGTYTLSINRGVTAAFGWKASDDFDGLITAENDGPSGIWSDGTTMWVTDWTDIKIYAYNLATKARDASKDFDTLDAAENNNPVGIWSDGTTMWVADYADSKVYAYDMTTKARDASKDFDTLLYATGIWSDGTTMWVASQLPGKIYAYDMSTKARDAGKDFNTLIAAGNSYPGGIWSNNITMWATDEDDDKLYAYNMASKARDADKDFNTLIAAGNGNAHGIWATTTMWASDASDGKIYSYNMPVIAPNTPAAGTPAVTAPNVFRVPAELGVDLSGITDTDGTTGIASNATYKWQRFAANGTTLETDSIGTASTYTLTDADAGKTLKVVVSYTDDGGNSEGPLTSAATRAITAAASCAAPTLTGGAVFLGPARKVGVGEFALGGHAYHGFNKAADAGSIDNPSFTTAAPNDYEILGAATKDSRDWMVALNGAFHANVQRTLAVHFCDEDIAFNAATPRPRDGIYYYTSATPPQHWAPHAERTIYVSQDTAAPTFASATVSGTTLVITLSEDLGAAGSLANSAFTVKKGPSGSQTTLTLSSTAPVISGSTVTLTLATAVTTTDTAVKVAYTKPMSGSANKLRDEFGNETATFPDQDVTNNTATNTPATGVPTISGTAAVGQTLTASTTGISDTDGLPSAFAYQWKRVDSDGTSNPTNIGTNSATYTLTDSEVGKKVLVEVSFTDNATNSEGPLVSAAHPSTGTVRAADTTAPTVTSITPQDPTSSPTNSDSLTWRVTFSEAVSNVDSADFVITGTTATLTVTAVTSMTGVYDVTASGGDLATVNGAVTLAFAADQNIVDPSDNTLTATAPTGINEPTFEMDNTVPTFVSGTANGTLIVMTFSEELDPNSLPQASSFSISALSSLSVLEPVANSVSIEGAIVTLTVTPAFITDHAVQVYNNAYDDGMGRVPLKDFASNEVEPAATGGSYSVTNQTPIGPPASLTAEAGDGRVRLVWTAPAGVDFQTTNYQYRYAAGTSVPVDTDWTGTNSTENFTALLSGLANGTPHTFEVRAVRSGKVGATATASATPLAAVCSTPDLGDRREVWSATLTVGRYTDSPIGRTLAGYSSGVYGSLGQNGDRIIIGGASYTIDYLYTTLGGEGIRNNIFMALDNSKTFTSAVRGSLRFHWCSDSSGFDNSNDSRYLVSHHHEADWSIHTTRELALSLPANNDATGKPDITGRALAGQTLTAGMGDIADADGLPQNTSDFAWQWIRIADATETAIQDATSSTYTLTDDDVGKKVLVEVSFTDSLTGAESLASAAYPSTGTVRAADNTAPTVSSIERHDPTEPLTNSDTPTWRVTFSEAVKNVDATDFTIAGTTAAPTVTAVTLVTGGYDVTPSGGDIASLTGTITLAFAANQNIADTADNDLAATAPTDTDEPTFEMDKHHPNLRLRHGQRHIDSPHVLRRVGPGLTSAGIRLRHKCGHHHDCRQRIHHRHDGDPDGGHRRYSWTNTSWCPTMPMTEPAQFRSRTSPVTRSYQPRRAPVTH